MLICIQCSLKALLEDKPPPSFDETGEEHLRKYHPDLVITKQERMELERKIIAKMEKERKR